MTKAAQALNKKALLIVNPVAGRKTIQRSLSQVVRCLMDSGYLVTVAVTSFRGEAVRLSAEYGSQFDLLLCAGGDGTVNECLTGLAEKDTRMPFGYIPCGSTNDFALSHDIPVEILSAAKAIVGGRRRQLDIGCFSERYFLHHALFGAFTRMAYSTDQTQKNLLGYGAYVLDGLREMSNIKPVTLRLDADGLREEGEYVFGAVSVNRYIAGIYTLPEELIGEKDGRLAAVLIKAPKTVADWDMVGRSLLSGDPNCAMVKVVLAKEICIQTPDGLEWSLDGESSGLRTEVRLAVKQAFLQLQG